MLQRCENPNNPGYKWYGSRGIKVCDHWHLFENFYEDMGERPEGKTLDRWPNNSGDYKPGNARWATPAEQRLNNRITSCGRVKQKLFIGLNNKEISIHLSNNQHAFAKKWGLDQTKISRCLLGKAKTHKGWKFKFLKIDR